VLPAVPRRPVPLAGSWPPSLASSQIPKGGRRSLTEPPGFMNSALPRNLATGERTEPGCRRISGVFAPTAPTNPWQIVLDGSCRWVPFKPLAAAAPSRRPCRSETKLLLIVTVAADPPAPAYDQKSATVKAHGHRRPPDPRPCWNAWGPHGGECGRDGGGAGARRPRALPGDWLDASTAESGTCGHTTWFRNLSCCGPICPATPGRPARWANLFNSINAPSAPAIPGPETGSAQPPGDRWVIAWRRRVDAACRPCWSGPRQGSGPEAEPLLELLELGLQQSSSSQELPCSWTCSTGFSPNPLERGRPLGGGRWSRKPAIGAPARVAAAFALCWLAPPDWWRSHPQPNGAASTSPTRLLRHRVLGWKPYAIGQTGLVRKRRITPPSSPMGATSATELWAEAKAGAARWLRAGRRPAIGVAAGLPPVGREFSLAGRPAPASRGLRVRQSQLVGDRAYAPLGRCLAASEAEW